MPRNGGGEGDSEHGDGMTIGQKIFNHWEILNSFVSFQILREAASWTPRLVIRSVSTVGIRELYLRTISES